MDIETLRNNAETGPACDQYNLGVAYLFGQGVERDVAAAEKLFRIAATKEYGLGLCHKGLCVAAQVAGIGSEEEAANWHRIKAEQGDPSSQVALAAFLIFGRGIKVDNTAALEWFRKASETGDADGQCSYGMMLFNGRGVSQDKPAAFQQIKKAAEQGVAHAQYGLGFMYANGHGVDINHAEALKWYRLSAEQDCAWAYCNLGWMYQEGWGVESDGAEAANWYRKAADKGIATAQLNLGHLYMLGGAGEKDLPMARKWLRLAAKQGNASAKQALGDVALHGEDDEAIERRALDDIRAAVAERGQDKLWAIRSRFSIYWDVDKLFTSVINEYLVQAESGNDDAILRLGWLYMDAGIKGEEAYKGVRSLAERGDMRAQLMLGDMLNWDSRTGRSVEGIEWVRKAAEQGHAEAQERLSNHYVDGWDEQSPDKGLSFKWMMKAARQGRVSAQCSVGWMYSEGSGVEQDEVVAAEWFHKAVEQGDASAAVFLGNMYEDGRGVARDDTAAVKWYRLAADQAYKDGYHYLGRMYEFGRGVEKDFKEALRLYRLAMRDEWMRRRNIASFLYDYSGVFYGENMSDVAKCRQKVEKGDLIALIELGLCYYGGCGVDRNPDEAEKYFRQATEKGSSLGQLFWACMIEERSEGKADPEALKLIQKAADQGLADAQVALGWIYDVGYGVPQDHAAAASWYQMAGDQVDQKSLFRLGKMYAEGDGVIQNDGEAAKWFRLALEWNYIKWVKRTRALLTL